MCSRSFLKLQVRWPFRQNLCFNTVQCNYLSVLLYYYPEMSQLRPDRMVSFLVEIFVNSKSRGEHSQALLSNYVPEGLKQETVIQKLHLKNQSENLALSPAVGTHSLLNDSFFRIPSFGLSMQPSLWSTCTKLGIAVCNQIWRWCTPLISAGPLLILPIRKQRQEDWRV